MVPDIQEEKEACARSLLSKSPQWRRDTREREIAGQGWEWYQHGGGSPREEEGSPVGLKQTNAASCYPFSPEARSGPLAILDALYQALAGCELLQRQPSAAEGPALTNPLLVSC
jgi:hypothetical protein